MISSLSRKRLSWYLFVTVFIGYQSLKLPVLFAFEGLREFVQSNYWAYGTDVLCQLVYLLDIFINLRTSYIERETGDEIWAPKLIFLQYLKRDFIIDIVANLPLFNFVFRFNRSSRLTVKYVAYTFSFCAYLKIFQLSRI